MYKSKGTLKYYDEPVKLIVVVDENISKYYYTLIPKWKNATRQKYAAHISVVRNEDIPNKQLWKKYEGEEVEYYYDPIIQCGKVYYWLNVFCKRLEEIRLELGMSVNSPYTLPPEGFIRAFHITLANSK